MPRAESSTIVSNSISSSTQCVVPWRFCCCWNMVGVSRRIWRMSWMSRLYNLLTDTMRSPFWMHPDLSATDSWRTFVTANAPPDCTPRHTPEPCVQSRTTLILSVRVIGPINVLLSSGNELFRKNFLLWFILGVRRGSMVLKPPPLYLGLVQCNPKRCNKNRMEKTRFFNDFVLWQLYSRSLESTRHLIRFQSATCFL